MTDKQQQTTDFRQEVTKGSLERLGADLARTVNEALGSMSATLRADMKRRARIAEVGALFELYHAPAPAGERPGERVVREKGELARLRAAIAEYETDYLADLITFARMLDRECGPVWEERRT